MDSQNIVLFPISFETLVTSVCMRANYNMGCTFLECETCRQPCKAFIRKELRRLCGLPQVDTEASTEEHDTP